VTVAPAHAPTAREPAGGELGVTLELLRAIWGLNHAIERASARMDVRLGVTAQQRLALRVMGRGPISPGALARLLCVDASTVSVTLRRLESKGLVKRSASTTDRRQVLLSLTKKGRSLDRPDTASLEGALERTMQRLGTGETRVARRFLSTLTREIESHIDPG
jgi:DNA-binding MarR family transcriptional regulator